MNVEITITEDGSHSLYVKELDEHFHSQHGAIQESEYVYILQGLQYIEKPTIHITEIGFGTGLNALLTAIEAEQKKIYITYVSYEKFPINKNIYSTLNFPQIIGYKCDEIYSLLMNSEWNTFIEISEYFRCIKIKDDILNLASIHETDLIYYDAFAPNKQPEMWTKKVLQTMYNGLADNGILVTYCAKGDVRRTLKEIGFKVERLPGPPGKWEMIRASKI